MCPFFRVAHSPWPTMPYTHIAMTKAIVYLCLNYIFTFFWLCFSVVGWKYHIIFTKAHRIFSIVWNETTEFDSGIDAECHRAEIIVNKLSSAFPLFASGFFFRQIVAPSFSTFIFQNGIWNTQIFLCLWSNAFWNLLLNLYYVSSRIFWVEYRCKET